MIVLKRAREGNWTVDGNEFQTLTTLSTTKYLQTVLTQLERHSLYAWPRVWGDGLKLKNLSNLRCTRPKTVLQQSIKSVCNRRSSRLGRSRRFKLSAYDTLYGHQATCHKKCREKKRADPTPDPRLPSKLWSITALPLVPNYTAWWQADLCAWATCPQPGA